MIERNFRDNSASGKGAMPSLGDWFIFAHQEDAIDLMLLAVEKFPEIHVVTQLNERGHFRLVNYYEPTDADAYYLYRGNPDPDIEFTEEFRIDDWSAEELEAMKDLEREEAARPLSTEQIAAINFAMNALLKASS
jgi:hypothetical protein